jgi:signal transduction histidine kinase
VAFGAVIVALGLVLAMTTTASFRRERLKSVAELMVAAQSTADSEASMLPQMTQSLSALTEDPNITAFDAQKCAATMQAFSAYASQAGVYVLSPQGSVVCSLGSNHFALPVGDWIARTRAAARDGLVTDTVLGVPSGNPLSLYALPIPHASAQSGALVVLWDNSAHALTVPGDTSKGVEVIELDRTRSIVVAASANAAHKPGALPTNSWMRHEVGSKTTRVDSDGVTRLYQEVHVEGLDHYVLAAMPKDMALVAARGELRTNMLVAAAVVFLVSLLGILIQRRIAKPIKSLRHAITAAADGQVVDAVIEGPAEVAAVARAFNKTINERLLLERNLADALKEAQRASKLKSQFLANMSHEIRTPMNGVLGMLSLLEDAKMSDTVRECLHTMGDSATALMGILNELLDFSKLEAGMLAIESVEFTVRDLIRTATGPWVAIAARKSVPLVASVDDNVPDLVAGDPTRVRQILTNLIDNAVKFTSHGRIAVTAKKVRGDVVRFEVSDSGIGISESGRSQLFEPFVQADGTTTRRYGGTGLGLAICKQLTDFMGGGIGVDSTVGEGSTFWFELPLPAVAARNAQDLPVETTPEVLPPSSGVRVLVVDDNLVNQKVATQMVRKLGHVVEVASDGVAALRAIDAGEFDLVLMDVQMPVMDGLEATSELRRRGNAIPVVAMTASALEEDRQRCEAVGMDGYVVKPMDVDGLGAEINRVLSRVLHV